MEESSKIELVSVENGDSEELKLHSSSDVESPDFWSNRRSFRLDQQFDSMNALEILRETVRILRYNAPGFLFIGAILICPVSAVILPNVLVDQSFLKRLTIRVMLVARSCGLPLSSIVKQSCQRLSEMILSAVFSFPLHITFTLLSKAAIVYSVDCTYYRKKFDTAKFFVIIWKIWRRLVATYMWVCMVVAGCLALFLVLLVAVCNIFSLLGFASDLEIYPAMAVGFIFSIIFANVIIICNLAVVISVLEDVSGPQALLRSSVIIQGQTQVGLLIFLGSTIGLAFVEGLFEHRVKTLSYGDGSSRIWEGPLLVIMYSFVVLIDSMMSAVFYFSCRSSSAEGSEEDSHPLVEVTSLSSGSLEIQ
ncbi:hypothetical protein ACHQM5_006438 [Ranunculus cassubicifolius]